MPENKEAIFVTFGNFKGGTGKTTNSAMIAHALSMKGYKVLPGSTGQCHIPVSEDKSIGIR
ncbi:AAA family ATPase [Kurthia sp. Dielmo]|uniref:AAA family ATPase n=1 Tax=Kurthia sp. Dielmo TaxID=1033738 RepID=UPI002103A96A|nr:AAA family ATPase [Kurthia sp. Dielmo]